MTRLIANLDQTNSAVDFDCEDLLACSRCGSLGLIRKTIGADSWCSFVGLEFHNHTAVAPSPLPAISAILSLNLIECSRYIDSQY
jgi:hypothetical protein